MGTSSVDVMLYEEGVWKSRAAATERLSRTVRIWRKVTERKLVRESGVCPCCNRQHGAVAFDVLECGHRVKVHPSTPTRRRRFCKQCESGVKGSK